MPGADVLNARTSQDIVVTGSLIRGTAKDTALPADVIDQRTLERRGQPTVPDVIRTLPSSGAVIGETNLINAAVRARTAPPPPACAAWAPIVRWCCSAGGGWRAT